jgi:hypothetical protein
MLFIYRVSQFWAVFGLGYVPPDSFEKYEDEIIVFLPDIR